jgi:Tfp pilus assembly PilM family ATPase
LKVLDGERGLELPIDRLETGQLTPACKQALLAGLKGFQNQSPWKWRERAVCALPARGVSLRRLHLPAAAANGDLERLLALQMEREFPLPPQELAWSYCRLQGNGGSDGQPFLIAAVKREILQEYSELLTQADLVPVFTLGALARTATCPPQPQNYSVLDFGRTQSELVTVERGLLASTRIVPWGGDDLTQAIQTRVGLSRDEAERRKANAGAARAGAGEEELQLGVQGEVEKLVTLVGRSGLGERLYLTGESARCAPLAFALTKALGPVVECERIELPSGSGRSAATVGLQRLWTRNGAGLPLAFQINHQQSRAELRPGVAPWRWIALAGALAGLSLTLRYAEPFLAGPALARRVAQINSQREGLPSIDHELGFLQYLETNQPPLVDSLYLMANLAPQGARLDSATMTRRGDLSMRGSMANAEQTSEFRSKLVDSGFFETVVLDELTPTPDRQKVTFRLTAQLKPADARPPLPAPPPPAKPDQHLPPDHGAAPRPVSATMK